MAGGGSGGGGTPIASEDLAPRWDSGDPTLRIGGGSAASARAAVGHYADDAAPASAIGFPRQLALGDHEVGTQSFHDTPVFNAEPYSEASVSYRLTGDPSFALVSAPDRLRPSREGLDPGKTVRLVFSPSRRGRFAGSLEISMVWPTLGRGPEVLRVPLAAEAHRAGEPTLAEQAAEDAANASALERDAQEHAQRERTMAAIAAEAQRDTHFPAGPLRELGNARDAARDALDLVFEKRKNGADAADKLVSAFVRPPSPKEQPSLAEQLAWVALDMATAGVAGAIARRLEPVVASLLTVRTAAHTGRSGAVASQTSLPGRPLVALFTDAVKDAVKQTGRAARSDADAGSPTQAPLDGQVAFFLVLHGSLADQRYAGKRSAVTAHDALLPTLLTAPGQAVAAMLAIAEGLRAEADSVTNVQLQAALEQWLRYLAQTSMGAVGVGEAADRKLRMRGHNSLTDTRGATHAPRDSQLATGRPLPAFDGLIDVHFIADPLRPQLPASCTWWRIAGVSAGLRKQFAARPLHDLAVPVRAIGSLGSSAMTVTVTRDEGHNIAFDDDSAAPGQQASWLSRKVGDRRGSITGQTAGARQLLRELLSQPLGETSS